jgi:hypothetical protein
MKWAYIKCKKLEWAAQGGFTRLYSVFKTFIVISKLNLKDRNNPTNIMMMTFYLLEAIKNQGRLVNLTLTAQTL